MECSCGHTHLMHLIGWPSTADVDGPPPCSIQHCKCTGFRKSKAEPKPKLGHPIEYNVRNPERTYKQPKLDRPRRYSL